jgi:single-stranded-DNA-specific exonuclease
VLEPRLQIAAYPFAAAARLERELGISHVLAQVLARRGLTDPEAARAWLAADVAHDPSGFAGIDDAVALVLRHTRAGARIVVHGDYDVDGVCSTAVLVRALRRLGADVGWYLPSRSEDGYGLSPRTVERLARDGTRLLVTADCGITAVDEVAAARAAGMDVLVTDHHTPRADGALPDAPIVHPAVCGYPCPDLCATGVAYKLAGALLRAAGEDPAAADEDLDLVALATVADVVPLHDENRRLVRTGLRALASTAKPGLRALMRVSRTDPGGLSAHAVGFRLAPRINAAGRLARADAALELVLTDDEDRAAEVADELDAANAERRHVETRILFDAEGQVREAGERPAYVLAGEGWHSGVVGIVAARIAERHHRPAVLVALDGDRGTGSGRSIPAFDLLAGLHAGAEHLERHGGHRAAAGLEIRADRVDAFRAAFEAHAASVLAPEDLVPTQRVDAVVPGDALGLGLAEELERLEPCGAGNPGATLLVPAATFSDPVAMGEGKHARFSVTAGGARSRAVAFGNGGRLPVPPDTPVDATFWLERNEWGGVTEPRLVLRSAQPCAPADIEVLEPPDPVRAELDAPLDPPEGTAAAQTGAPATVSPTADAAPSARTVVDRRGAGIAGVVADLVATGEPVLVVVADASRRLPGLRPRIGGFALLSHLTLEREPELAHRFAHAVFLDPPAHAWQKQAAGSGYLHLAYGAPEIEFARTAHARAWDVRPAATTLYRALRDGAPAPDPDAVTGRALRVLRDLELVRVGDDLGTTAVPRAARTDLSLSPSFRAYHVRYEDGLRFLSSATQRAA